MTPTSAQRQSAILLTIKKFYAIPLNLQLTSQWRIPTQLILHFPTMARRLILDIKPVALLMNQIRCSIFPSLLFRYILRYPFPLLLFVVVVRHGLTEASFQGHRGQIHSCRSMVDLCFAVSPQRKRLREYEPLREDSRDRHTMQERG